ncbi:hypothetical protein [Micromonospora sp. WMMD737]|uniref:hypothetical protein n=1 Tax=Micromonospora sp. WMMD737 TaxID=3404113 RepID=UPI003B95C9F1
MRGGRLAALRSAADCARWFHPLWAVGLVGVRAAADWMRAFALGFIGVFLPMFW